MCGSMEEGSRPQLCLWRELVDCVVVHSCLQEGNALFKNLCSKFSTRTLRSAQQGLKTRACRLRRVCLDAQFEGVGSGAIHTLL